MNAVAVRLVIGPSGPVVPDTARREYLERKAALLWAAEGERLRKEQAPNVRRRSALAAYLLWYPALSSMLKAS